jgi:hypothetical protein
VKRKLLIAMPVRAQILGGDEIIDQKMSARGQRFTQPETGAGGDMTVVDQVGETIALRLLAADLGQESARIGQIGAQLAHHREALGQQIVVLGDHDPAYVLSSSDGAPLVAGAAS